METYRVGVDSKGFWKTITDGVIAYKAENDVRHHSEPPNPKSYSFTYNEYNRISQIDLSKNSFEAINRTESLTTLGPSKTTEKAVKVSKGATIGAGLGMLFAGPVGAFIGGTAGAYISQDTERAEADMKKAFFNALSACGKWKDYDKLVFEQKKQKEEIANLKFEKQARANWSSYYRLKSIHHIDQMTGLEFEHAIAGLYANLGYAVELTPPSSDYGVDLLVKKGKQNIAIQAKRYSGNVGVKAVQEVLAGSSFYQATSSLVITNALFTKQAKTLATKTGVKLVDKIALANMWQKYSNETSVPNFNLTKYKEMEADIRTFLDLNSKSKSKNRKLSKNFTRVASKNIT